MEIFDLFCLNISLICFPIIIYTLFITVKSKFKKGEKTTFLEVTLYTILFILLYFLRKYNIAELSYNLLIPIIISNYKKKTYTSFALSIIVGIYFVNVLHFNIFYTVILLLALTALDHIYKRSSIPIYRYILYYTIICIIYVFATSAFNDAVDMPKSIPLFVISIYSVMGIILMETKLLTTFKTLNDYKKEDEIRLTISKISHEIKNPLSVIKGYIEVLDNKTIIDDKDKLLKEVNYALNIVSDFKDINHLTLNKKEFNIKKMINDILKDVIPFFTDKEIESELYFKCDYNIYADPKRIKQVLINIIKNAIEACERSTVKLSIKVYKRLGNIVISIKDNGEGMDKETIDNLFCPFSSKKENGTHLGLCLSKEIIDKHGGSISYFSKLYLYTIVTIKLPINSKGNKDHS